MTLKSLVIVSERYPNAREPVFTFVDELAAALQDIGVAVTVVSPQSLTRVLLRGGARAPKRWMRQTPSGATFPVIQPWYLSLSGFSKAFNRACYRAAVRRAIAILPRADAYYGHFWHSGIAAALATDAPVFVACGESEVHADFAPDVAAVKGKIRGVISVSSQNAEACVNLYGLDRADIEVIPNAVDARAFYPRGDRAETRRELGIAEEEFAVAFVGWFSERKGVKRVEAALHGLEGVKALYLGHGEQQPVGDNIAFSGRVDHADIPRYLSAADVFLLPTRAEGCCNAIVEAMACGLPVISSDRPFNDDLLNSENAIRIDPDDVPAIRAAVVALKGDPTRRLKMAQAARSFAQDLTIEARARRIRSFIEGRL